MSHGHLILIRLIPQHPRLNSKQVRIFISQLPHGLSVFSSTQFTADS
jgi:hypothetical protein